MESSPRKQALQYYNAILQQIVIPHLSNTTTDSVELERFGHSFLGSLFHGVYMADEIPCNLSPEKPYAIANLSPSYKPPGTHWIALARDPNSNKIYVSDSFGYFHVTPDKVLSCYGSLDTIRTDEQPEQHPKENNCGARCFAWIILMLLFGPTVAIHI